MIKVFQPIFITFKNRALKLRETHRIFAFQEHVEDYAINVLGITNREYFLSNECKGQVSADVHVSILARSVKFVVKVRTFKTQKS